MSFEQPMDDYSWEDIMPGSQLTYTATDSRRILITVEDLDVDFPLVNALSFRGNATTPYRVTYGLLLGCVDYESTIIKREILYGHNIAVEQTHLNGKIARLAAPSGKIVLTGTGSVLPKTCEYEQFPLES